MRLSNTTVICTYAVYLLMDVYSRPHREVRELTWGDFSEDLSFINLSDIETNQGKNRIVPVPSFIKDLLVAKDNHLNIFTGRITAPNKDYF